LLLILVVFDAQLPEEARHQKVITDVTALLWEVLLKNHLSHFPRYCGNSTQVRWVMSSFLRILCTKNHH